MNTNDLNTALYEKMAAEQDKFREWLKIQPPEEVLEDISQRQEQLWEGVKEILTQLSKLS